MTCNCCQLTTHRHGKDRKGNQRWKCPCCGKTFSEDAPNSLDGMTLRMPAARLVLHLLAEGNSIRSTERITEVHRDTILKLLRLAGRKAESVMSKLFVNLDLSLIQADEAWCFIGCKEKRFNPGRHPHSFGSWFVFVALDSPTKLVPAFVVGRRTGQTAKRFMKRLAATLKNKPQLSTDGFRQYIDAVEEAFGPDIDFAQLIKVFQSQVDPGRERYSPSGLAAIIKQRICGKPDRDLISTSHVERQNLTLRMSMRRLTRLTNGFSRSLKNLKAAVAWHFGHYNLCRQHITLKGCTPAMEAGVTDHIWTIEALLEAV